MGYFNSNMGFELKTEKEGHCEFVATTEGSDKEAFSQCVAESFKAGAVHVTVSIGTNPGVLREIFSELLHYLSIVQKVDGTVTIRGLKGKGDEPFLKSLKDQGFLLDLEKPPEPKKEEKKEAPKKEAPLEPRLIALKENLAQALKRHDYLTREKTSYETRITNLSEHSEGEVDTEGLEQIATIETETIPGLKKERNQVAKKLKETREAKAKQEEENKAGKAELKGKSREEKDPLKKKLTELEKAKEKMLEELKAKTEGGDEAEKKEEAKEADGEKKEEAKASEKKDESKEGEAEK